jgi:hypothetical protein
MAACKVASPSYLTKTDVYKSETSLAVLYPTTLESPAEFVACRHILSQFATTDPDTALETRQYSGGCR